jgi:hypothetical protein
MIFVVVAGGSLKRAAFVVLTICFATSIFEDFYIQGNQDGWLRAMHSAKSIFVYSFLIIVFAIAVMMGARILLDPANGALVPVEIFNIKSPFFIVLPVIIFVSAAAIMLLHIGG